MKKNDRHSMWCVYLSVLRIQFCNWISEHFGMLRMFYALEKGGIIIWLNFGKVSGGYELIPKGFGWMSISITLKVWKQNGTKWVMIVPFGAESIVNWIPIHNGLIIRLTINIVVCSVVRLWKWERKKDGNVRFIGKSEGCGGEDAVEDGTDGGGQSGEIRPYHFAERPTQTGQETTLGTRKEMQILYARVIRTRYQATLL